MKWLHVPKPLVSWKEPKAFVRQHRKQRICYGWVQFRIFLYLTVLIMGCWALGKLNPKRTGDAPSLMAGLGLSLFTGAFVAYGTPVIFHLIPSFISLYPTHLSGTKIRCLRFGLISSYKFQRESEDWVLHLLDLDQKETLIGIPKDELKMKIERALSLAGAPKNGLSPAAIAQRRDVGQKFLAQVQAYGTTVQKRERRTGGWFVAFLFIYGVLTLVGLHYLYENNPIWFIWLAALFMVIIGYGVMDGRYKKRLACASGLSCSHCSKVAITPPYLRKLALTHSCPYCGKPFYKLAA